MSLGSVSGIEIAKQVQRMIKTKRTSQQIIFLKFFSQFFDLIFCQKYILFCSSFSEFLLLLDPSPIISYRRTVHGLLPVYFCSFTLSDNGLRQWKLSFLWSSLALLYILNCLFDLIFATTQRSIQFTFSRQLLWIDGCYLKMLTCLLAPFYTDSTELISFHLRVYTLTSPLTRVMILLLTNVTMFLSLLFIGLLQVDCPRNLAKSVTVE